MEWLNKKYWKLPVWAWGLIAAVVVYMGYRYMKSRSAGGGKTPASSTSADQTGSTNGGSTDGIDSGGSTPGDLTGGADSTDLSGEVGQLESDIGTLESDVAAESQGETNKKQGKGAHKKHQAHKKKKLIGGRHPRKHPKPSRMRGSVHTTPHRRHRQKGHPVVVRGKHHVPPVGQESPEKRRIEKAQRNAERKKPRARRGR